ncbi:MAG: hypothetical protein HRU03_04930 [Nanoarchaeales archaeon]|nr:hypothetical protein [Nanoarchaeales archaeon]
MITKYFNLFMIICFIGLIYWAYAALKNSSSLIISILIILFVVYEFYTFFGKK